MSPLTAGPNVDTVVARILEREGGVGDVGDGKGLTRFGQTPAWLDENGFIPPSSAADAAVNYERWLERTRLDQVCRIDLAVGDAVCDFAVHSGIDPAIRTLQRALAVKVDGQLGPQTLGALAACAPAFAIVARRILLARLRFDASLVAAQAGQPSPTPDRRKYVMNWIDRIAAQLEALPA